MISAVDIGISGFFLLYKPFFTGIYLRKTFHYFYNFCGFLFKMCFWGLFTHFIFFLSTTYSEILSTYTGLSTD